MSDLGTMLIMVANTRIEHEYKNRTKRNVDLVSLADFGRKISEAGSRMADMFDKTRQTMEDLRLRFIRTTEVMVNTSNNINI